MSMYSSWRCHKCNAQLKPKNISGISNYIGAIGVIIPGYILLFYFKISFLLTMAILTSIGVLLYLVSLVYFYKTTLLEEV